MNNLLPLLLQVKCVDEKDEIQPQLNFEKSEIRWKVGQLLLFLDSYDTPRIPLRLFQKLCEVMIGHRSAMCNSTPSLPPCHLKTTNNSAKNYVR